MIIDLVCLVFLAYGFWVGYSRGIISTVLVLVSYVFGVLAAMKIGPVMGELLLEWFPTAGKGITFLGGVLIVFVLTLVLFRVVASGLTGLLESVNINFINQILGGVLSGLFFVFIYSGLVYFGDQSRLLTEDARETSITYPYLETMPDVVIDRAKGVFPVFRDFYNQAVDAMDRFRDGVEREERDDIFDIEE